MYVGGHCLQSRKSLSWSKRRCHWTDGRRLARMLQMQMQMQHDENGMSQLRLRLPSALACPS